MYVAADLNYEITEQDPNSTWLDAGAYWDLPRLGYTRSTFVGSHGASRVDHILVPSYAKEAIAGFAVDDTYGIPGHSALCLKVHGMQVRERTMRALPPLKVEKRNEAFDDKRAQDRAEQQWTTAMHSGKTVDELYALWSTTWEEYLINAYHQTGAPPRGRGMLQQSKMEERSTLRRKVPRDLAKLSNFVKRVEKLYHQSGLDMHPMERKRLWDKIVRQTPQMSRSYGVPMELPTTGSPLKVEKKVLHATLQHFRKARQAYLDHLDAEDRSKWKERLYRNGGLNKVTSAYVAEKWMGMPRLLIGEDVCDDPHEILGQAEEAWRPYFEGEPMKITAQWIDLYLGSIKEEQCPLPPIGAEMLRKAINAAKADAAPSQDSWRYSELKGLPELALQQLAELYMKAEQAGAMPSIVKQSWTALIAGPEPARALKLRPIALLSTIWRLYATVRYKTIAPWVDKVLPDCMHAYVEGRSTHTALGPLLRDIEETQQQRHGGKNEKLYLLALDASKAFPSTTRAQIWAVLARAGLPLSLIDIVENMYQEGRTRFRLAGRVPVAAEVDHPLRRGVHQGCPLSVVFFNGIQLPMVTKIRAEHETVHLIVYADDVVMCGKDLKELQSAFAKIAQFYTTTGIQLNPEKTKFWSVGGEEVSVSLGEYIIWKSDAVKVLGVTLGAVTSDVCETEKVVQIVKKQLERLARLPLALKSKQLLFSAVTMSKVNYDGWKVPWPAKTLRGLRSAIISVLKPALAGGPRAQVAVLCLKAHQLDPLLSLIWKLLAEVRRTGWPAARLVMNAMQKASPVTGPYSRLAAELRQLGFVVQGDMVALDGFAPLSLLQGEDRLPSWQHRWREALSDVLTRQGTAHRSDFSNLAGQRIDWTSTLKWHHNFFGGAGHKTALELVLTGGMLTNSKVYGRDKDSAKRWCPWGCRVEDTPSHRYWACRRFRVLRKKWHITQNELSQITRCCGIFPLSRAQDVGLISRVQGFMSAVMMEAAHDSKSIDRQDELQENWQDQQHPGAQNSQGDRSTSAMRACEGSDGGGGHDSMKTTRGHVHAKVLGVCVPRKRAQGRPKAHREPLPPHVVAFDRPVLKSTAPPLPSLRCVHCGGVGLQSHAPRFVSRHLGCSEGVHKNKAKRKLTQAEALALSAVVGEDVRGMGKWKRRRLVSLHT